MSDLPVVCVFGTSSLELFSEKAVPHYETNLLDCRFNLTDDNLMEVLAREKPSVILSVGNKGGFPNLNSMSQLIGHIWIHEDNPDDDTGKRVFEKFIQTTLSNQNPNPLVSVFTPAYKSGDKIYRPLHSLITQTYKNWEWIILDDSDDAETFALLSGIAKTDPRIKLLKFDRHSGSIGDLKRAACDIARGEYLVEFDHDDHLVPQALEWVVSGYQKYPEVGFIYTDFAECFEGCEPVVYGNGWGWGYGSYRKENHGGVDYMVVNAPNINPKTIRHIVAAPNHIRSWRKSVYNAIGGHNPKLHVVDDYELVVRTFLATRMGRIPKMCYVQYRNTTGNTSLGVRNKEIQRLVRFISQWYDQAIHERFVALGVEDFVWRESGESFSRLGYVPNPSSEPHCTITLDV